MKQFTVTIVFTMFILAGFGQAKKDLAISLSAGTMNSPYYNNSHAGMFAGLGFDYHITERHIISANYTAGGHDYFDNSLSNTPASAYIVNPKGTNAEATYKTFSVLYKYKVIQHPKFSIVPGVGAGILTHSRAYPYTQGASMTFQTSSWSDLVFPVALDINYTIFKNWQLGLTGGFLIHPDYPVVGLNAGPKLTYLLQ